MYNKILVPIAFDHQDDLEAVLQLAKRLKNPDGETVLLTVIEPIPTYAETYLPKDLRDKQRDETVAFLENIAKQVEGTVRLQLKVGNPGAQILEHADASGCDCIIIRSHKPGLEDYFLGSTAARVVRHAPCSVHVFR